MSVKLFVFVAGSQLELWRRHATGRFEVVQASGWSELQTHAHIDAGLLLFHLAERMNLSNDGSQSAIRRNSATLGPRYWIVSPRLQPAVAANPEEAIADIVLEMLTAVAAHNERCEEAEHITTVALSGTELGGHSALDPGARADAIGRGLEAFVTLFAE